jgi:hypothetical protein
MPRKNVPGSGDTDIRDVPAADVGEMEHLAIEKANRCISAIENALAVWELSKDKPQDLAERIGRLRTFHEALTDWERKAIRTLGKGDEMDLRVRRLKEFTDICYRYT